MDGRGGQNYFNLLAVTRGEPEVSGADWFLPHPHPPPSAATGPSGDSHILVRVRHCDIFLSQCSISPLDSGGRLNPIGKPRGWGLSWIRGIQTRGKQ